MHHPTDRITHTTAFVTPVMEHWLEREIAQWVLSITYNTKVLNHTICCYILNIQRNREGNDLFNDALNTFYLQLYVIIHMVNDHSDSERQISRLLALHELSFRLAARVLLYAAPPHTHTHKQDSLCFTSHGTG